MKKVGLVIKIVLLAAGFILLMYCLAGFTSVYPKAAWKAGDYELYWDLVAKRLSYVPLFLLDLVILGIGAAIPFPTSSTGTPPHKPKSEPEPEQDEDISDLLAAIAVDRMYESSKQKRHNGRCDGDCANCPPHYGYRYGRWYYGKGHVHGCEFGGNKGDGGS